MADVILKDVSKTYDGGVRAVSDVNLDIADGEFIVLVGPSGCGKSTTLRMIAGLEAVTGGTIAIGGRVVNDVHPKDRDIAMVFQNYALYPHMTVYKNMAFALKLRRMPRAEIDRRVRETARMLGLSELLDRKPKALSGGQRQRVAVGRAIVREPKAFLFDEPLSNLDAKLRVETRAELKSLHLRLRTTTVYVTHDQEEAMTLGDRVVVMSKGVVQQVGAPLEVYRRPRNRFVAGFLGTPPMSFLSVSVVQEGSRVSLRENHGSAAGLIDIPLTHRDALRGRTGHRLTLGIRPEALSLHLPGHDQARAGASQNPALAYADFQVEVVEPLGDRVDAYLRTPSGARLVARLDSDHRLAPGERRSFRIDFDRVHFFEPGEFGARIAV